MSKEPAVNKLELVQKVGDLVCEGCSPDTRDCGISPMNCSRILDAVRVVQKYEKEQADHE